MNKASVILLCAGLAGCATSSVTPSPTSDQVLAAQYRARNAQGAISGVEADLITDAYRRDIGKAIAAPSDDKSQSPSP